MRKLVCFIVLSLLVLETVPAFAVEGSEVRLRTSTIPGTKTDAVGQFDITVPDKLVFRAPGAPDIAIPYANILEFQSREQVKYHIGVLATIVVGLLKTRQKVHFLTISYRDDKDAVQVASFEVSKTEPDVLVAVLQARARSGCERREFGGCSPIVPVPRPHLP